MKNLRLLLLLLPLLAACSHVTTRTAEHVDLGSYHHIYVEHLLTDGPSVGQIIARQLRQRGYDALAGPLTLMPPNTELIVGYLDQWNFDFTYYLIEIDLQVRTAHGDKLLATGRHFRPSVTGKSPAAMVDAVLDKLFKPIGPALPEPAPLPGIETESPSRT